jgi:hypothetical protein
MPWLCHVGLPGASTTCLPYEPFPVSTDNACCTATDKSLGVKALSHKKETRSDCSWVNVPR